jgi:hypothetical protein
MLSSFKMQSELEIRVESLKLYLHLDYTVHACAFHSNVLQATPGQPQAPRPRAAVGLSSWPVAT